jgi:hypothetical protein
MTAIRLTFSVENGDPKLTGTQRVAMRFPPSRRLGLTASEAGIWLEVHDKNGNRLFARILDSTILSPMIEVRTGVGDPGLTMVKSRAKQLLHVIVPDDPVAKTFHILRRSKKGENAKNILSGNL